MARNLIYHGTSDLVSILEARVIKASDNLRGKEEKPLREQYERLRSELANYVRSYYARIGEKVPDFSEDRLANLVEICDSFWSLDPSAQIKIEKILGIENIPNFEDNAEYKKLEAKYAEFRHLIRGCSVYCGDIYIASKYAGYGHVLGIDPKELEDKDYFSAENYVWWQLPFNKRTIKVVLTEKENVKKTKEALKKAGFGGFYGFGGMPVKKIDFSKYVFF